MLFCILFVGLIAFVISLHFTVECVLMILQFMYACLLWRDSIYTAFVQLILK